MKVSEALDVMHALASQYKGLLKEHETIQIALKVLKDACSKKSESSDERPGLSSFAGE